MKAGKAMNVCEAMNSSKAMKEFGSERGFRGMKITARFAKKILALLVCALVSSEASPQVITVEARGKDQATAEINAKTAAARKMMLAITDEKFVKEHTAEIRSGVIARAGDYVSGFKVLSSEKKGNLVSISAEADVDRPRLTAYLKSLGAEILPSYEETLSARQDSERDALRRIFGEEVRLRPSSMSPRPQSELLAVTEEVIPGAELVIDKRESYEPQELFLLYYRMPEFAAETRNSRLIYLTVNEPDVPADYASSRERMMSDHVASERAREGYLRVKAPARDGSYEIRFFSGDDKNPVLLARQGFKVRTEKPLPKYSIARDHFLPGEHFYVDLQNYEDRKTAFLVIAPAAQADRPRKEIEIAKSSKNFRDYGLPGFSFQAPDTPGDYTLLLFDYCEGCRRDENNYDMQRAMARLDFKVAPAVSSLSEPAAAVPAEVYAGARIDYIFGCDGEWQKEGISFQIKKKGAEKTFYSEGAGCGNASHAARITNEIYEPGEYEFSARQGPKDNEKVFTREFRVVKNPADENRRPEIAADSAVAEQDSGMTMSGVMLTHWKDPFAVVVPKGFPLEAAKVLEKYADGVMGLGHRRTFFSGLSVIQPPGDYELRLYDARDDSGTLQASFMMHVMTDAEMASHKKEIRASIDRYIKDGGRDSNNSEQQFKKHLIESFHVPEPPRSNTLSGVFEPPRLYDFEDSEDVYADIGSDSAADNEAADETSSGFSFETVALTDADCEKYIDQYIREASRIDITLGRDGDFEGELANFGKTLLFNLPLPEGSKLSDFREGFQEVQEMYGNAIAGMDQLSEGEYKEALKNGMVSMLKIGLNHCSDEECLAKLLTRNSSKLKERMARMSEKEYAKVYGMLDKALGKGKSGKKFLKGLSDYRGEVLKGAKFLSGKKDLVSNALDVTEDIATLAGTIAGGDYTNKEAYANVALSILALEHPILSGSIKLSYQAYLSSRDFARDVAVIRMYGKWKKIGADTKGSAGYDDFARIWKEDWKHHKDSVMKQTREVMINTLGNELTKKALNRVNREKAREYLRILQEEGDEAARDYMVKSDFITEDEVYDFLEAQFTEWEKAENNNSQFARDARAMKDEYRNLKSDWNPSCQRDFNSWFRGQEREANAKLGWGTRTNNYLGDRFSSLWNKGCPREVEGFKAYYRTKKEIERELLKWNQGGRKCSQKNLRKEARDMLCVLMESKSRYLNMVANYACDCGWDALYYDNEIIVGEELKQYRREAEIVNVMTAVDNDGVLGCLCNYGRVTHGGASGSVGISFNPGATGMAPGGVCGRNQRGACFASGWSCWHFTMPTDEAGLRKCGYYQALKDARDKNAVKQARDEVKECNANYEGILQEAGEKEKKRQMEKRARDSSI